MKYGTDWLEIVAPDEDARFAALGERMAAIQRAFDVKHGEKSRTLHRKGIGGFAATFTVREDLAAVLPPELHVGPLQPGARYEALIRLSNGTWQRTSDKAPDIRGFSIKLLGVGGKKALTGTEDPKTQDFLLIHLATAPAESPEDFVTFAEIASSGGRAALVPRMLWALGPLRGLRFLRRAVAIGGPFPSFASARFYSASPYRLGPTAARYALTPVKVGPPAEPTHRDFHGEAVGKAVRDGLAWDFQVQLYQDDQHTPIERNHVEWLAEDAPFVTIARLEIAPTDPDSPAAVATAARVETLAFDPWHAVEELRPIGAFNRARKVAYFLSTKSWGPAPEPG